MRAIPAGRLLPALLFMLAAAPVMGAPIALVLDTPYTQNFNTLPQTGTIPWVNDSTIPGWYSVRSGTGTSIVADTGNGTGGNLYSYGSAAAVADRAIGTIGSSNGAAGNFFHGVALHNGTGATITSLDVAYVGEQWRSGGATSGAQTIAFSYLVGTPTVTGSLAEFQSAGNAVTSLDFTSPINNTPAGLLDGNVAANRVAKTFTISGLNIPDGTDLMLRWSDPDHSGTDHGLAIDDVSVTPHGTASGGPTLGINDVSHNEGDTGTTTYTFTVTLSQPAPAGGVSFTVATADGTAAAPSDYTALAAATHTIAQGNTADTFDVLVNGDTATEANETFFVNLSNPVGAVIADAQGVGTIVNDDFSIVKIHDVQGSGAATPIPGSTVTVEGVATALFLGANKLNGFFVQEEDADADADPNTSEGIFVFCSSCAANTMVEGQRVRVTGSVSEFQALTEITTNPAGVLITDFGNHMAEVTPSPVSLPISGDVDAFYEARESMLITYVDTLTVSEYFELFRFGQIELVGGDRPRTYTEDNAPSVAGYATHLQDLARRQVILDDDNNAQEAPLLLPDGSQSVYYPRANGGFSGGTQGVDFFRGGDQVHNLTGVLQWGFPGFGANTWRIRPSNTYPTSFTVANPRPATPPNVGGSIRAVGMNLLNYFTTIDTTSSNSSGPCGPSGGLDCRGADSVAELNRQRDRASIVVCTLNPDVAAFMELENTTPSATITDLLGAVNASCGGAHPYAFINTGGTLGTDAIRVAQIYRTGVLSPVGSPLVDLDPIHNRPPTAQTYDVVDATNPAFGKRFTVVANHFKSKGSCPASGVDSDQLDGQSCWAATRTLQSTRLLTWVNGTVIPAAGDPDVLLLGDFNSYAHETPVTAIEAGGYHDLETELHGVNSYSYLFSGELGHLDFAFASNSFASQVTGADAWHINADEADLFDYNDEIKDTGEAAFEEKPDGSALLPPRVVFQPGTPYRASDHDPVLVGLFGTTSSDLSASVIDAPDPVTAGSSLTYTITMTNNGPDAAGSATWSDTLPAGTSFASLSAAGGWSCTTPAVGAGGAINCSNPSFALGNAAFTFVVTVGPTVAAGTVLSNSATISSGSTDPVPANNIGTATTTVATSANLSTTVIDSPDPVVAGNNLTYTITVTNAGPSNAATASLSDALPTGTTFVSQVTPAGWSCATPVVGAGGTVSCSNVSMAVGSAAFTLVVNVAANVAGGTVISNTATAASSTTDPSPGNESATANTTVQAAPQGNLTITPTSVPFGNQTVGTTSAPMTVTLGNSGTASLNVTTLTPAATPFARSGGTCSAVPITIAASASCTLIYTFSPTATGAANQSLTVTANAPGSGTIVLSGTGTTPQADVSLTI
ncbi:MAG: ExeM/NucH family extracellular endonuclease, partial [Dokdonella sp.]